MTRSVASRTIGGLDSCHESLEFAHFLTPGVIEFSLPAFHPDLLIGSG